MFVHRQRGVRSDLVTANDDLRVNRNVNRLTAGRGFGRKEGRDGHSRYLIGPQRRRETKSKQYQGGDRYPHQFFSIGQ